MRQQTNGKANGGFTLVEILAVMALLGLLFTLAMPMIGKARAAGALRGCQSNLRQQAMALQSYVDNRKKGRWPKLSGIQFLLVLHRDGELENKGLEIYLCPGTNDANFTDETDKRPGSGYEDWENLDQNCISYAGRDNKNYPINKNKLGSEVISADDNDGRANHEHMTNLVYADSTVDSVDVVDYRDELDEEYDYIPVGPDSPHEGLAKLLVDY